MAELSVDFGSTNRRKLGFFLKFVRGTYEHPYRRYTISGRVAKFEKNRPRDVKNSWTEKIKSKSHDQNITVYY